ncbi:MAG: rhomboid family intramembrane serine protease [Silvanigrellaceae bacterium]
MAERHLEEDELSEFNLGLVLKGSIYQATYEYKIERNLAPWTHPVQDQWNASKLLMRSLPMKTLSVAIVYAIIVAMVSIFVWVGWFDSLAASRESVFGNNEFWRIFTAQFQHADSKHLLNNLFPFVGLGWILWGYFGFVAFPLVPIIAGAVANLIAVLTYPPEVGIVGLSGTVFAMAGLWSALYIKNDFRYPFRKRILRAAGFVLVLFFPLTLDQNISDRVHILGGLAGLAAGFWGWGKTIPHRFSAPTSSAKMARVP